MSPSLHQTPVDPGFQRDDHTPHLARVEGISSEMGKEGKKGEKGKEGWKEKRKGRRDLTVSRGGEISVLQAMGFQTP